MINIIIVIVKKEPTREPKRFKSYVLYRQSLRLPLACYKARRTVTAVDVNVVGHRSHSNFAGAAAVVVVVLAVAVGSSVDVSVADPHHPLPHFPHSHSPPCPSLSISGPPVASQEGTD